MAKRKSWREKLTDAKDLPKVQTIEGKLSARWGQGTVVIPAPLEVDAIMKQIPRGRLITINEIRTKIAHAHGATIACPITVGIFAWIAAHAAEEASASGETESTPYWRTLKTAGELNPKYPGGLTRAREHLEAEGHRILTRGQRAFVENCEACLVDVPHKTTHK